MIILFIIMVIKSLNILHVFSIKVGTADYCVGIRSFKFIVTRIFFLLYLG